MDPDFLRTVYQLIDRIDLSFFFCFNSPSQCYYSFGCLLCSQRRSFCPRMAPRLGTLNLNYFVGNNCFNFYYIYFIKNLKCKGNHRQQFLAIATDSAVILQRFNQLFNCLIAKNVYIFELHIATQQSFIRFFGFSSIEDDP